MKCTYLICFVLLFSLNKALAQKELSNFFNEVDVFLQKYVSNEKIDYQGIQQYTTFLSKLIEQIRYTDFSNSDTLTQQAFLINAYNLHMLSEVVKKMPLATNFDKQQAKVNFKIEVAGMEYTFTALIEQLRSLNTNPLFHFALVNNGFSFHTLNNEAYRPSTLNDQFDEQIRRVVNNPKFKDKLDVLILPDFLKKYKQDFIEKENWKAHYSQKIVKFLNDFRDRAISNSPMVKYKKHVSLEKILLKAMKDTLRNKREPYQPMAMLKKGFGEIGVLNSIKRRHIFSFNYVSNTGISSLLPNSARFHSSEVYATHLVQYRYGVSNTVNIGMETTYQFSNFHSRVLDKPKKFTDAYKDFDGNHAEKGIRSIGPKIWFSPFKRYPNIIIESTVFFPALMGLKELKNDYFFDNGISVNADIRYYAYLKRKLLLDVKIGGWIEDIGTNKYNRNFRFNEDKLNYKNTFSLPVNLSLYYLPNKKLSLYSTMGVSLKSGKIELSPRETDLNKHRGLSSTNHFGLVWHCSSTVAIQAAYYKLFYGFSYANTYRNYEGEWVEEYWLSSLPRKGAGFDLNFTFSF